MSEKDYLKLLRNQLQPQRVVCGANYDAYGRAVVITGIPKQYKEGEITYVHQRTTSYEDYMINKHTSGYSRTRRKIFGKIERNYK